MDFIEIPRDLKRSNCLEWKTRYDRFNFLYLYIRHLFPEEMASIIDFRQTPIKKVKSVLSREILGLCFIINKFKLTLFITN